MELFAGVANVWQCVSDSGVAAARVDITYGQSYQRPSFKQDSMNILSSAGFAISGSVTVSFYQCWRDVGWLVFYKSGLVCVTCS